MFNHLKVVCLLNPIEQANRGYSQGPGRGIDGLNTASEDKPQIEGEASTAALSKKQFIKVYPRLKL